MHQGTPEEGDEFLATRWPEARAVSDPDKALYSAFGLGRGSFAQLFGPGVWKKAFGSLGFGVGLKKPVGDPFLLGGAFVVRGSEILAAEPAAHAGSVPDLARLAQVAAAAA